MLKHIAVLLGLIALVSSKNVFSASSPYLLSYKKTIHYCFANLDRARSLNAINPSLNSYKTRLETFVDGYGTFFRQEFKKELSIFETIEMNQSQRNSFIVDNILSDFEKVLKERLDKGEAASLTGYFSRQMSILKRTFKTDVLKTKTYKTKQGNTVTLPMFFNEEGTKAHPIMVKIVGQFASDSVIANDIVNYASRVNNVHYLPNRRINGQVLGSNYKYELRELVKAFYSPIRNREGLREACREFGF